MATVAVLGLGLLGAGFAERLVADGHAVRVWNRSPEKAAPLVALGAVAAASPAEAVAGAARVHLILSADDAVDAVIAALRPGLGAGVPVVDHSTNLPARVAARAAALRAEGVAYLHAPVFMAPANARQANGLMIVGGDRALVAALTPVLSTMTGRVIDAGPEDGRAATLKIVGNGLLISLTATMGDLFQVAAGAGVSADAVLELFGAFSPRPDVMGRRVLAAAEAPASFELTMARKDLRLMLETAGAAPLAVLPGVAAAMDRALAAGQGARDFAVFAVPGSKA